ncbi:MAG TPA: HAD family hydrolase [Herpetosiphonaceae bacterium]|nr:HAD family hydrolase [Herpetosiphonaceae bacterium]
MKPDTTLLCDADGNLYPSEEPAFEASVGVTNRLVAHLGSRNRFTADELRSASVGMNFRSLAQRLADQYGASLSPEEVQCWVDEENRVVTAHLRRTLRPVQPVLDALTGLSERFELAVVSSSALSRLAVCFTVSGLDPLFPAAARFSAQDSLSIPSSKPDPAVYRHATRQLGLSADRAVAVEDAVAGVASAVAAGVQTVGNLAFVAPTEKSARARALLDAGALLVVKDWEELDAVLLAAKF